MSNVTINLTPAVYSYMQAISLREPEILKKLRQETQDTGLARMQIAPEQGQFLQLLVKMLNVRKALEIGVFTGYSALSVALALPEDGCLLACEINAQWLNIAKRYAELAGVADKIDFKLGPALDILTQLLQSDAVNSFDFIFIDADKLNYKNYYEAAIKLLRPGGVVAIDNVLWQGKVADPEIQDPSTVLIRELNAQLLADSRITLSMLPVGDGLTLALKN